MNKVTIEQIYAKIKGEIFMIMPDRRTTLCQLTLENGYTVIGQSACVDIENFDASLGRHYAKLDAIDKVWPLEGYLLAERMFLGIQPDEESAAGACHPTQGE
jgi:hypothetical protein